MAYQIGLQWAVWATVSSGWGVQGPVSEDSRPFGGLFWPASTSPSAWQSSEACPHSCEQATPFLGVGIGASRCNQKDPFSMIRKWTPPDERQGDRLWRGSHPCEWPQHASRPWVCMNPQHLIQGQGHQVPQGHLNWVSAGFVCSPGSQAGCFPHRAGWDRAYRVGQICSQDLGSSNKCHNLTWKASSEALHLLRAGSWPTAYP